jgi:predicted dehydrogenase
MIGIAVIGAGHWGPNLIRNFHNHQASEVHWVVDRDSDRLAQVRSRFPDIQVTEDEAAVWSEQRVDAVVIATPTSTHAQLGKRALEAGMHTLVEKPISTNAREGDELCLIAERGRLVLMVGHVFLYNAAVQAVRKYVQSGELGRIHYISMVRTNLGPIRTDVNAAWDLASHDVSIANFWLDSVAQSVSAVGGTWLNSGIEDAVFATLRYPGNVLVNMHASWLNPRKSRDITVVGDRRMLTFDDMNLNEPIRIYDKQVTETRSKQSFVDNFAEFRASVREGDITIPRIGLGEPLRNECEHFIECIGNGKKPLTDGRSAVAIVRSLEALARSMRSSGREEQVLT